MGMRRESSEIEMGPEFAHVCAATRRYHLESLALLSYDSPVCPFWALTQGVFIAQDGTLVPQPWHPYQQSRQLKTYIQRVWSEARAQEMSGVLFVARELSLYQSPVDGFPQPTIWFRAAVADSDGYPVYEVRQEMQWSAESLVCVPPACRILTPEDLDSPWITAEWEPEYGKRAWPTVFYGASQARL